MQRSFEELGTPLADVTFCVVDLETTGASAAVEAITEIGACKVQRGELRGTFHTLVNPGRTVPAFVRLLTGISDPMLVEAPAINQVLPSFLEFVRDSVLVAHNARFDIGFLNAALTAADYPPLANRVVDTARLARRILAGEVRDHRLATLADHLRCAHRPCHRAYADVLATIDVLHHLIERVAGFGITTLEDLARVSSARLDRTFEKRSMADDLPRGPGVYRFIGARGNTLYVGKASNVRDRVRSYFHSDTRRKTRDLLKATHSIEADSYPTSLEAEVYEARAIEREKPPYNRAGKKTATWYLKVSLRGRSPKINTTRVPKDDGCLYVGPFTSSRTVRTLIDAIRDAFLVHRCSEPARCNNCAFAQMSRCIGTVPHSHRNEMRRVASALVCGTPALIAPLTEKMKRLAASQRFEEAAEARDRAALFERLLRRLQLVRALVDAGDVVIAIGGRAVLVRAGQLAASLWIRPETDVLGELRSRADALPVGRYLPAPVQREAAIISGWLSHHSDEVSLLHVERGWAVPA